MKKKAIFSKSEVIVRAGRFYQTESIELLETRAAIEALRAVPIEEQYSGSQRHVRHLVDNSTFIHVEKRRRSPKYILNLLAGEYEAEAAKRNLLVQLQYLPSGMNWADGLTRDVAPFNIRL